MKKLLLTSLFAAHVGAISYTNEAAADMVTFLPGASSIEINFHHFSGYLSVEGGAAGSKQMHYWFVESEGNPETDPVALWTNGGPGCSGLLGMLTEQGPFKVNKDQTLSRNEFAWTSVASILFIEQPCGVGFSYSTAPDELRQQDYKSGDALAASDNFNILQAFFKRFPHLLANDLYITSESYGGHYIPTLAREILDKNEAIAESETDIWK